MRGWLAFSIALAACSRAVPTADPAGPPALARPLPAGACGFDPYLGEACGESPEPGFAVVLLRTEDLRAAERALARAPHAGGYPFVATLDELPAQDARLRGIVVIAGLWANAADATAAARAAGGEVLPLASQDEFRRRQYGGVEKYEAYEARVSHAVEITSATPAYRAEDLERVETDLDEELATKWVPMPEQYVRRARALAALVPACTVAAGRVFATNERELYRFRRTYAPAKCDDGREAWVPWRATRRESVVADGRVHQVILVECDVPTLETRPLGAPPGPLGPLTDESCGD